MSAWSRIAVLAAGAAVGAAAGRIASSDGGRRAAGELAARTSGRLTPGGERTGARENRLASRALRAAQDIRVGMRQRETELRAQLRMPAPGEARLGRARLDGAGGPGRNGQDGEATVIDHAWTPPPASGAD